MQNEIEDLRAYITVQKAYITDLENALKDLRLSVISECEANYTAFTGYGNDKYLYTFQLLHGIIEDNDMEQEYNNYLDEIYGKEKKK